MRTLRDLNTRDWWLLVLGVLFALGLLARLLYHWVPPAPPKRLVMSTGAADGAYHAYAQRYREELARFGVDLVLLPSAGAAENLQRLLDPTQMVDVALVQGGLATPESAPGLVTLGSLFYEPLWLFYRGAAPPTAVAALRGKRIAVGAPGSGTYVSAMRLVAVNGLADGGAQLLEVGGTAAADLLLAGGADAAFLIGAIDAPAVRALVTAPGIALLDMQMADAYTRRLPQMTKLVLPRGLFDLRNDIPPVPTMVVALTANLLAREDLHPVAVDLLLQAARRVHGGATLLNRAGEFPAPLDLTMPLDPEADRFYRERPSFLRRVLPFWAAVWLERMLFLLIPLAAIAIPVLVRLPALYAWRVRSRIYRWYGELGVIEARAQDAGADPQGSLERLDEIEARLNRLRVPKPFAGELYTLRLHLDYIRGLVRARAGAGA